MSSIYVLEPPTKGKVVMNTTKGPIDIELWPKEAPKAVRNFVQLAMEGYYENTIFNRVIKGFLVQGGDPTGTGKGGESIYGSVFTDEFHSRLRFNHRGLVACVNEGPPHTNGSQFFMTLDRCDWLDRKNTIFGKVTGDSVFNLLQIGDLETDLNDKPLEPIPKVTSFEILWNPFEDIIPRQLVEKKLPSTTESSAGDKRRAVKKLNLLSFGEEAEEEEKELAGLKEKIKSSHDVLNDPRLIKDESNDKNPILTEERVNSVKEALGSHRRSEDSELPSYLSDEDESTFDVRMRLQVLKKRRELEEPNSSAKLDGERRIAKDRRPSPRKRPDSDSEEEKTRKKEKLKLKKHAVGSEARADSIAKSYAELQLLNDVERERHLKKHKKRRLQGRSEDLSAKIEKFRSSMFLKSDTKIGASADDVSGWHTGVLKFKADPSMSKDGMDRKDDPDAYVVEDPLLVKGKEKFNRMQAKLKKRDREWAGKSIT